jgi:carbamoyl-phosphate synthase large subunit
MGFHLYATDGTARYMRGRGVPVRAVRKLHEGRPNGIDLMKNGQVQLLINTPLGKHAQYDDYALRQAAIAQRVSYTTTMSAANAACDAILSLRSRKASVRALQEWHDILNEDAKAESLLSATAATAPAPVTGTRRGDGHMVEDARP